MQCLPVWKSDGYFLWPMDRKTPDILDWVSNWVWPMFLHFFFKKHLTLRGHTFRLWVTANRSSNFTVHIKHASTHRTTATMCRCVVLGADACYYTRHLQWKPCEQPKTPISQHRCSSWIGMLISFFSRNRFSFWKNQFFSIIEFWFCASLTVGLLMLQSHYVLART